jgi:sugar/nucleoside kinase (ribokinase family)
MPRAPSVPPQAIVAGHACLDIFPSFPAGSHDPAALAPGKLVNVGPALRATGGAVANTGLALHRLGVPVRLIGKVGDDLFGSDLLALIRRVDPRLPEGMVVAPGQPTSYSIVLSPAGVDRTFLHCPGCNDTFGPSDLDPCSLRGAKLFHFGYPPLMRRMYSREGRDLARLLNVPRKLGLTVSLDMSRPDPNSDSGRVDWQKLLRRVLPGVDIFLPSIEELLFMIDRPRYDALIRQHGEVRIDRDVDGDLLSALGAALLDMGVAIAAIKLGDQGMYLRTTDDESRLRAMGAARPADLPTWCAREMLTPCLSVKVTGTTGAGDCTIAGFLAALLRGDSPGAAISSAVAVGACSVEHPDATSGVPTWTKVRRRLAKGWSLRPCQLSLPNWRRPNPKSIFLGPHDRTP